MSPATLIAEAGASLAGAKLRTALAAFGIATGVGSVIAMLTIGEIVSAHSRQELEGLGPDLVRVTLVQTTGGPMAERLAIEEVADLAEGVAEVRVAAGMQRVSAAVHHGTQRLQDAELLGVTGGYAEVAELELVEGRFVSDLDGRSMQCVLGAGTAAKVRAGRAGSLLGVEIRVGKRVCTVVGVTASAKGHEMLGGRSPDQTVYLPMRAALEIEGARGIMTVVMRAAAGVEPEASATAAARYVEAAAQGMRARTETAKWLIEQIERQARLFRVLLASIGGIALTVAGVGVMNLMLTSVAERRTEIGIRRAVGARRRDIRRQFVAEAVALCTVGGIFGIGAGVGCTWAVSLFTDLAFTVAGTPIWVGLATASAVGIVFGLYPAQLAARVDPIVALRA